MRAKVCETVARGFDPPLPLSDSLFPHQRVIVEWACRKGTAAVFAAFELGKSRIQLEIARQVCAHTGGRF